MTTTMKVYVSVISLRQTMATTDVVQRSLIPESLTFGISKWKSVVSKTVPMS